MKKVKVIVATSGWRLQDEINNFIRSESDKIISIQITETEENYTALIFYTI